MRAVRDMDKDLKLNLTLRLALFAAIALWAYTEHQAREACGDNQACLAASL